MMMLTVPCDDCNKELKFIGQSKQECDDKMVRHMYEHYNGKISFNKYKKIFLEVYNKEENLK